MKKINLIKQTLILLLLTKAIYCGPMLAALGTVGCGTVCGAGAAACFGASGSVQAALTSSVVFSPFAALLAPCFAKGCIGGFVACMGTCETCLGLAPSP
ncbi:unnamed protein product [Brachionus calyciflorus]|uniref:Uncharacterized protein n=1 Tax=Brachionus calyciflorus TaxID=104777 RepID=A0A813MFE8_9BILA|nr:unnamed protein product [Brachionus calyciflorus]